MLDALYVGVQRLDQLVRNLLDSASLQAGYFRVTRGLAQLRPLIDEAVEIMQPLTLQRAQVIAIALPDSMPPVVADERRIVQVLVNLLSNASKFGPRGDTLYVTVTIGSATVRIGITDHGPGIAPTRRDHLFERFLHPGPETMRAQGIGLGLAIVKAIVERHGGQVVADSGSSGTTTDIVFADDISERAVDQLDKQMLLIGFGMQRLRVVPVEVLGGGRMVITRGTAKAFGSDTQIDGAAKDGQLPQVTRLCIAVARTDGLSTAMAGGGCKLTFDGQDEFAYLGQFGLGHPNLRDIERNGDECLLWHRQP